MTPTEKAKELVNRFWYIQINTLNKGKIKKFADLELSKQCALICVDEVLSNYIDDCYTIQYYKEVKQEIKKL